MARVYLLTSVSSEMCLDRIVEMGKTTDTSGRHCLTDDPHDSDVILFVENWKTNFLLGPVASHPLVRRYPEKVFCFCENDTTVARVPGIYASLPRHLCHPGWAITGPYLWMMREPEVPMDDDMQPDLLFSFVGSEYTHPIRKQIMALKHPRAYLEDIGSKTDYMRYHASEDERKAFRHHYDLTLRRSKFGLCPPGMACSSVRFFETLRAGRVPVLMADEYSPPPGPDWSTCCVTIPSRDVACIPRHLEELEPRAEEMGQAAQAVYAEWFSPARFFTRVVDWCLDIQSNARPGRWHAGLRTVNQLRQQPYFGNLQRLVRRRIRETIIWK
jgi:hypothetical protein